MIFNRRDRSRHRAHIPRAYLFRPFFNGCSHTFSVELSGEGGCICLLFLSEELPGNHQFLNFAGAFADGAELHVAVKLLRWIVLDEAVSAMNLHALVGQTVFVASRISWLLQGRLEPFPAPAPQSKFFLHPRSSGCR